MSKVLILGGDSDYNLGDAAILKSVCHQLIACDPAVQITVTSSQASPPPIPGVVRSIRRGASSWLELVAAARASDLVMVGGGGLFQDDDSRIKMPYWATRLAMLRTVNRNLVGHSLGVGPLQHADSRLFARIACTTMQSVSVRDGFAQGWLERSLGRSVPVVPDPAFMLPPASPEAARAFLDTLGIAGDRPLIGVALRRWFHPLGGFVPHKVKARLGMDRGQGSDRMAATLEQLATALKRLTSRLGASVLLMPSYNVGHEADAAVCEALAARLPGVPVRLAVLQDPSLYKAVAGQLALMLSARMHPLILAAGMGVPLVGLAYNGKFAGVFDLLGIPEQLLWLKDFPAGSQVDRLEALALRALETQENVAQRAATLGAEVAAATSRLLG